MKHVPLLLLLCLLVMPVSADYVLTEFCPDGYASGDGDEYFILSGSGDLTSYSVSDGEGTLWFPENHAGDILVARSAEAYYKIYHSLPDLEIINSDASVPDMKMSGKFQMANSGDQLTLYRDGMPVQSVSWPDELAASNGRVHVFEDGVWDKRIYKIGQSRFSAQTFSADLVTLFVSPDSSYEVISSIIDNTKSSLFIGVYEFDHPLLAQKTADACRRGVDVTILVEGGPVGGMGGDEKGVLNYLTDAGAHIFTIESVSGFPARYRYHHAKYLISDYYVTAVVSENFGETGIPVTGTAGNRGWGAAVYDSKVASYFIDVISSDLAGYDIYPWKKTTHVFPEGGLSRPALSVFKPMTIEHVLVTPVISPDTSYLIDDLVRSANTTLDVEQAYISPYPGGAQNEWLGDVILAAQRGVKVRVILDGMYYNTQEDADNDELVATLNRAGLPISARLLNPSDILIKLHNKGVIADKRAVLISSVNWSFNSPNNNREAGLIITDERAAEYYTKVFDSDFSGEQYSDPVSYEIGFDVRFILAGLILVVLIVILIIRRKLK